MASSNNRINISINGKEIANEIGAIEKAYRDLNKQVKTLSIGGDDYNKVIEDMANLKGVLNDHRQGINGVEKGYALAGNTLRTMMGYAGIAFGVDSVIAYGREVFKAGVELTALERKAKIVFADTLPAVTRAAEQNATAMGLTAAQYTKAAAEVGDLLIPMGFTRDAAAQMSVQLTNLGGVLSEWSGGSRTAAETTEILRKALLGERDALEGLGIQITEEQVKQALQAKGYEKLTGKAEEQAKALVTLEMIMDKSQDAQAAYATNQDSITRKSAEMSAKFAQIKEDLGRALIPLFADLVAGIAPIVTGFSNLIQGVTGFESSQRRAADGLVKMQLAFNNEMETLKTANLSHDARVQLIDKINVKYKEYLPNQIKENTSLSELSAIQSEVNKKYGERIAMLSMEANLVETNRRLIDVKKEELKLQESLTRVRNTAIDKNNPNTIVTGQSGQGAVLNTITKDIEANKKAQQDLQKEMTQTIKAAKEMKINVDAVLGGDTNNKTITPNKALSIPDPKDADKAKKDLEKQLEEIRNIYAKHATDLRQSKLDEDALAEDKIREKYAKDLQTLQEIEAAKTKASAEATIKRAELIKMRDEEIANDKIEREIKYQEQYAKDVIEGTKALAQAEFDAAEESRKFLEQRQKERETSEQKITQFIGSGSTKDTLAEEVFALDAHYKELLRLADEYGINTTGLKEKYESEKAAIDKKYKDKEIKTEAERNILRLQSQSKLYSELGNIASSLSDIFQTEGEKQNAFQKSMALAQIAFDTASGISSAIASGMKVGITPIEKAVVIAGGIALVLTNIARAKKILSDSPEVKRQKFMGGFDTVQGATDGRIYQAQNISQTATGLLDYNNPVITPSGVLANERGKEYYVSATDLRKPVVMNYVRAIEAIRTQRADGGYAPAPATNAAPSQSPTQDNTLLINTLMRQNELLTQLLTQGVKAIIGDQAVLDIEKRFQTLNSISNGFYR
jgi:hypothetical protein